MQNYGPILKNFRLTNTGPKEVEFGTFTIKIFFFMLNFLIYLLRMEIV